MSRIWMRVLVLAVSTLLYFDAEVSAADNWRNFDVLGDQCTAPVSIDGQLAAVEDQWTGRLYYYDFSTGLAHDTGVTTPYPWGSRTVMISGHRIAYFGAGDYDPSFGYAASIWIYDISTGQVLDTGIRKAAPASARYNTGRYFDGEKIVYTDTQDGHVKLYYVATGAIVDTGLTGAYPNVSGNQVVFQEGMSWYEAKNIKLYNIATGQVREVGTGMLPYLAGSVVAYWRTRDGGLPWTDSELCYYRTDTGVTVSTGLVGGVGVHSTDGVNIAVSIYGQSIKIVNVATGAIYDTGQYGCAVTDLCWITISGDYLSYERWESGTYGVNWGDEIYPPTDYNGDGAIDSACVAIWFRIGAKAALETLVKQIVALNLAQGIENSLDAKLQAATQALSDINENNNAAAVAAMQAFVDAVRAQSGKQIATSDADALILAANQVISRLN